MHADQFRQLLNRASTAAVGLAERFVSDDLNSDIRYHIILNQSYDGHATEQESLFPHDDGEEFDHATRAETVAQLCRDSRCPEWIDISVERVGPEYVVLRLLCCGRFTADHERMYYHDRNFGPFGIKSPDLPPNYREGDRFALPTA